MSEGTEESTTGRLSRRVILVWLMVVLIAGALAINPVSTRLLRLGLILCVGLSFAGLLAMTWRWRWVRYPLIVLAAALLALPLLPGRAYEREALREGYVRNLYRYEGVPYVWGGEKELGVDCSGFPRRALLRTNVTMGLMRFNGALVREGLSLWWHDSSARALGEGYRGRTRVLGQAASVNAADHANLEPGDLAVTADGIHVLVYVGEKTWLEADPGKGRVIRVQVPEPGNGWFKLPVVLVRWTQLDGAPAAGA